ncbi:MAG: VOC family protein [Pseudolabrys sp.]|nr:VOC family protein [Pseudolabrys sp.]
MQPSIYRLGYVAMNVANFDECVREAQEVIGLNTVEAGKDRALFTSNQRHAEMILHRAAANEFRAVGLEAYDVAAVDRIAEKAKAAGLKVISTTPSLPVIERSVTFMTSEGHVFEAHTPMPRDQSRRYAGGGIHPRCVDHVNLAASDPAKIAGELRAVLGLKLSDRTTGDEIVWLRAGDNRHHTVGLLKGKTGMHHISWEFAGFSEFRRLGDLLDTMGRRIVWGPGRHGPGDNLFSYYVDAGGFLFECTAEMEIIDDLGFQPRPAVDPGENLSNYRVVNRWGQLPSAEWMGHHNNFAAPQTTTA